MLSVGFLGQFGRSLRILLTRGVGLLALSCLPITSLGVDVTLAWDPSPDATVVGYNVYYGVGSRTYTNKVSAGSELTLSLRNLPGGATYYFAATAYTADNLESDFSEEISAYLSAPTPNAAPTAITLTIPVTEDAPKPVTLQGTDPENDPLTFQVVSQPKQGSLSGTAPNLTYLPAANFFGTDSFTYKVSDGQLDSAAATVTLNVAAVNDPPTLATIPNLSVNQDSAAMAITLQGITSGAANEPDLLIVTATSSNPALIPQPLVSYVSPAATGSLIFTPAAGQTGTATITVTVNDGKAAVSSSFQVTVVPVTPENTAPAALALTIAVTEDTAKQVVLKGSDPENDPLTFHVLTQPKQGSLSGTAPNLTYTPATNFFGTDSFTYKVNDGKVDSAGSTVTLNVAAVNDPPRLAAIPNLSVNQDSSAKSITLQGINSGAANEADTLTLSATSSAPSLIPQPQIAYVSPANTGTLSFTPAAGQTGTATITVTVNDGKATASSSFQVTVLKTVLPNNTAPTITDIPEQFMLGDGSSLEVAFSIADAETAVSGLSLRATSSVESLLRSQGIVFSGTAQERVATLTPEAGQTGETEISLIVSDGSTESTVTFRLTVLAPQGEVLLTQTGDGKLYPSRSGLSYTVTAVANPGQVFAGWRGSIVSSSPTLKLKLTTSYVLEATFEPISVTIEGAGLVSPNLANTRNLIAGRTYSMTAKPAAGYEFAGWSGGVDSTTPKITFVMEPGMELNAEFVPSPFIPVQGRYCGLFYENDEDGGVQQHSSGSFRMQVTKRGSYSGQLVFNHRAYPFSGKFTLDGTGVSTVRRTGTSPLLLNLKLGVPAQAGTTDPASIPLDTVQGEITAEEGWKAALVGDRATFHTRLNPAPYAGNYTLVIPGQDSSVSVTGFGHGSIVVKTSGITRVAGMLADGTAFTRSTDVSKLGEVPVHARLYSGKGSLLSWLKFENRAGTDTDPGDDLHGLVNWIKPAILKARYYPEGLVMQSEAFGSVYLKPVGTAPVLNLEGETQLQFTGANLAADLNLPIQIGAKNVVTTTAGIPLKLTFNTRSGLFQGTIRDVEAGGVIRKFRGVVVQNQNKGFGLLFGDDQTGAVLLAP